MAYNTAHFGYQHPAPDFAIDRDPSGLYDEDADSADAMASAIIEPEIISSPDRQLRRASTANASGIISPADSQGWEQHFASGAEVSSAVAPNSLSTRPAPPLRAQTFVGQPQPPAWTFDQGSGHCTPTSAGDALYHGPSPAVNVNLGPQYRQDHVDSRHAHFIQPGPALSVQHPQHFALPQPPDVQFIAPPQVQTPMSPHSHQDYMAFAANEAETRGVSRRMHPTSPPRTSVDAQRRDGIRKKNGRIEIPQERSIQRIDQLLEGAQDEDFVKELKQQKRLLRNREAALASRQRKKKHTEDLESREKDYAQSLQTYEHQAADLRTMLHEREQRIHHLQRHQHELKRQLDIKEEDARQLQLRHNEETSVLRKRIQLLTEDLDVGQAPAMSAVPSSTGFTDFNAGMEALSVDTGEFDDWFQLDAFTDPSDDAAFHPPEPALPPTMTRMEEPPTLLPTATHKSTENSQDPQVASGLLFFLLLCGAFVASKPGNFNSSELPEVPEDVRAAAPAVLDDLLSDSAALPTPPTWQSKRRDSTLDLRPTSMHGLVSRTHSSRMDRMHRRITSPTKQQEINSAFSLTTAQFASISDPDFHAHGEHGMPPPPPIRPQSRHQRSVGEALTHNRNENAGISRADVYTRSLLMEKVSPHVVQQFKEFVRDYREIEARQQQRTADDGEAGHEFKVEP